MRIDYLGDALDHFKGSILRKLQAEGLILDLGVDPMATDVELWSEDHYRLYAALLGTSPSRLFRIAGTLDSRERRTLGSPHHGGDLFLDPDTGVRTGSQSPVSAYILPTELKQLLTSDRVVVTYQHAWRTEEAESVRRAVEVVKNVQPRSVATAYVSRQVALIFFSTDTERVSAISASLRSWLGEKRDRVLHIP